MFLHPPFDRLRCPQCDVSFNFPSPTFSYTDRVAPQGVTEGDFEVHPMLTERAWCKACDAPTYVERVPTLREFERACALVRCQDDLLQIKVDDDLLHFGLEFGVDALLYWQGRLSGRRSRNVCLVCGSGSVVQEAQTCRIRHEACEGALLLDSYWISGHHPGRSPVRFFSWNGEFLWEQEEQHSPAVLGSIR